MIKNCVIWNDWGKCLEIGAETFAKEITNITFESNHIIHVSAHPLDCMNVDQADVHDITFKNITIEYDEHIPALVLQKNDSHKYENPNPDHNPNVICVNVVFHPEYSTSKTQRGKNWDFLFENIRLYGRHKPKFTFAGLDSKHKVSNVKIKDFYLNDTLIKTSDYELHTNEFCENIKIYTQD